MPQIAISDTQQPLQTTTPVFCYVLASHADERLPIMAHASALSLRMIHPDATILLVVDSPTASLIDSRYSALRNSGIRLLTVDTPFSESGAASRFLKTRLRMLVQGDLVFLDVDTLILRELSPLWQSDTTITAVELSYTREKIFGSRNESYRKRFFHQFAQLGWPSPQPHLPYISSGVFAMKDNAEAHAVSERWHESWLDSRSVMGGIDQPALFHALQITNASLSLLPEDYNCITFDCPKLPGQPAVLHFGGWPALNDAHLLINYQMRHLLHTGTLDVRAIDRARKRNDAWVSGGPGIKNNLRTGRYASAVKELVKRVSHKSETAHRAKELPGE